MAEKEVYLWKEDGVVRRKRNIEVEYKSATRGGTKLAIGPYGMNEKGVNQQAPGFLWASRLNAGFWVKTKRGDYTWQFGGAANRFFPQRKESCKLLEVKNFSGRLSGRLAKPADGERGRLASRNTRAEGEESRTGLRGPTFK